MATVARRPVSLARRVARALIWWLGIPDALYRFEERRIARRAGADPAVGDGPPLPPPLMRVQVCGSPDAASFLDTGRATIVEFDDIFTGHGRPMSAARSLLDIGCGCGRLARWTIHRCGDRITGVDINGALVRWCRRHLPGRWVQIRLRDALPPANGGHDLAYACSVVTHLREDTTALWFADIASVMAPGGLLLVTFHDEQHPNAARPGPDGRSHADRLALNGYVIELDRMEGSNRLAAFCTVGRLTALAGDQFELVEYRPSLTTTCLQAIALFRRHERTSEVQGSRLKTLGASGPDAGLLNVDDGSHSAALLGRLGVRNDHRRRSGTGLSPNRI